MTNDNPAKKPGIVYLLVIGLLMFCSILVFITGHYYSERINRNAQEYDARIVKKLLQVPYDNNVLSDTIKVSDSQYFGGDQIVTIYRARQGDRIVATVFKPLFAKGYRGPVQFALCISNNGEILATETIQHNETEGLGALIDDPELHWLDNFKNISLSATQPQDWGIRSEGGKFDQITGATVTSRGVINAIHKTLEYHERYRDKIYSTRVDKKL